MAPEHCLVCEDTNSGLEAAHWADMAAIDGRTIQLFNPLERKTA